MLTRTVLINELVDELNELKLSTMAATLDDLYHKPGFLEMDRLTLIAELIGPQFQEKVSTTLKNRLTAAHLKGSPEELSDCVDSDKREYLPAGITEVLSSFDFIICAPMRSPIGIIAISAPSEKSPIPKTSITAPIRNAMSILVGIGVII